jgi:glycosyltransferase involved in cell wall biosynthesis
MNQTPFLSLPSPAPNLQACVIIPARDESEGIEATLDGFARQRDIEGNILDSARFEMLLLANNCRDQTAKIARKWSQNHPSVNLHVVEARFKKREACVGYARRLLMDTACQRLTVGQPQNHKPRAICSTGESFALFRRTVGAALGASMGKACVSCSVCSRARRVCPEPTAPNA